jgi:hypothetical protein
MQQHPDPWTLSAIATDISGATKPDATQAHAGLLNHLCHYPRSIIADTDGSQLCTAMAAGYTIPTGFPEAINAIVPMGNTSEVFDTKLWAIYKCLLTCPNSRVHPPPAPASHPRFVRQPGRDYRLHKSRP